MAEDHLTGEYLFLPLEKVTFGPGCLARLCEEVDALGRRAFVITGTTLATKTDLVARVTGALGARCAGVFSATVQHVPQGVVFEAARQARAGGADVLVSFGGGSPIDTAKAVALCLAEDVTDGDGLARYRLRVRPDRTFEVPGLDHAPPPQIAIPTTLSAGEYTHLIGVTDEARRAKDIFADPRLAPRRILLDPEVCAATPRWLWAASGLRAVDHAVEAVYSVRRQPATDGLALLALEMLFRDLPASAGDPADLGRRGRCQVAAWLSMFGRANLMPGLSHGLGHILAARCNVVHGYTSSVMLPHVMEYSLPGSVAQQARMAWVMGAPAGLGDPEAAARAPRLVADLVRQLDLPSRLRDVGVSETDLPLIAADAMEDFEVLNAPHPVQSADEVLAILRRAF